jgi:hypothetical protein
MYNQSYAWFLRALRTAQEGQMAVFVAKACRGLASLAPHFRDAKALRYSTVNCLPYHRGTYFDIN